MAEKETKEAPGLAYFIVFCIPFGFWLIQVMFGWTAMACSLIGLLLCIGASDKDWPDDDG